MKAVERIQKFYNRGFWNKKMVADAVVKGKITAEEFEQITGEQYSPEMSTMATYNR